MVDVFDACGVTLSITEISSRRVKPQSVLNHDEVSELLGRTPTHCLEKGEVITISKKTYIRDRNVWQLEMGAVEPADLDQQVTDLLTQLTSDFKVWTSLAEKFEILMKVTYSPTVYMSTLEVSPTTLAALGSRAIKLVIEIADFRGNKEETDKD